MVEVVAENGAEAAPGGTVTDAGTVRLELVLDSVTGAPPVTALLDTAWLRVTVQVVEEFDPRLEGVHDTDNTVAEAIRLTLVLAELPL
jgi:hypothetical protein